ncbi:MAG: DNA methylase [Oscillospiraceae bacterium]|nr:DNA methylase [Oscillospiraceae bacterium]
MEKQHTYLAIDLKSFYASVECAERNLDPLSTNLVVADASRTEKTICLAVTPSLKAYGIPGRARLFEVIQRVKEVNAQRLREAIRKGCAQKGEDGSYHFSGTSCDAEELKENPSLELNYVIARPRMKLYEEYSTRIFSIYSKYIAPEDIIVYSIDECFMDVTRYLDVYGMSARQLAITMIREVLGTTGITATAGIGTNLYLCKIAMDIVAKRVPADRNGVRIAELDERSYREKLWCHRPMTDFWRVGAGTARRLELLNCFTMGDVARLSKENEAVLYDAFGVNAELLIDHAWGWEPTEIRTVKAYRPVSNSLSTGQVLAEPYPFEKGRLIVREMTEQLVLDLVRKGLVTRQMTLTVNYDRTSLVTVYRGPTLEESVFQVKTTGERYRGAVTFDHYGRPHPKHAHGTGNLPAYTSSGKKIVAAVLDVYDRKVDPDLLVRRINITAEGVEAERDVPNEGGGTEQLDFFTDYEAREKERERDAAADEKERRIQEAALQIRERYGKNALLKGMNLLEGATAIGRNGQIGGHRSGEESAEETP